MFAGPELPGVDLLIPDLTYLQQCQPRPAALFLTHGHEDHIGGVPYVWPLIDGPVYGTPLTLALLRPKLEEHGIDPGDRLVAVQPRQRVRVGDCEVEFLRVTHSMPDCVALAIHTPAGTIVHTGDFKIDQTPIDGQHFDVHRFAELGSAGVLALFADSTNIDRKGFTGSELEVRDAFEEIFTTATGKLVVTAFASSVYRMQILVDLAAQFGRKVAFVGRGMLQTSEAAQRLGTSSCRPAASSATPRSNRCRRPRCCAWRPVRRASRLRRCRASPSTITGTSRCGPTTRSCFRPARFPATRRRSGR